jgi:ABC-type multidrug transport system ATPase subunit
MPLTITNSTGQKYGPVPIGLKLEIPDGYSVFAGKNNAGKSCLLQLIFREVRNHGLFLTGNFVLIPADRPYIRNTTSPSNTLQQYNENLFGAISAGPRTYPSPGVPDSDSLHSLLLHRTDFIRQVNEINRYLLRLGFDELVLKATQIAHIKDVQIVSQGTGVRSVLPVIAALTSKDINLVLIDEPELALEARSQRVLKELFLEAAEQGKMIVVATQSHIFLNKQKADNNLIVDSSSGETAINRIADRSQLLDITYGMLGNSLEDLFFPSNFLIVEGSSDQVICQKVAQLLGVLPEKVKVISARGIDNIQDSFKAIRNTLVPLVAGESPYSKRVVVLADNPPPQSASSFETLKSQLKDVFS